MLPIVFSHANSFPAGTYRLLFELLRARGIAPYAIERFGHDPRYPVTNNWTQLVEQLADYARPLAQQLGTPVYLVGHSLGGFLSVMAAALYPEWVRGVIVLDSPLIGGWKANALGMVKQAQVVESMSPAKISRRRRFAWANNDEALQHFRSKPIFARWHPQVLQDYVEHGLEDHEGQRILSFHRDVETAIYKTLPHNLGQLLRRHPLRSPVAFIGGLQSEEMQRVGMAMTRRITGGRITFLDGSHLFPMELPHACAAAIEATLLNLQAIPRT